MQEFIARYWERYSDVVLTIVTNCLLAIGVLVVSVFIAKAIRRLILRANKRLDSLDATLIPVFCSISTYLVYAVGLIVALDIFGVNTTSIIALLGAAGLAVGLALKDTLGNIAAGTMLLILRPFRMGDFVEFGSVMGTVKEINLLTTILETFDGLYVSSPNGIIWGNTIKNFTRNGKRRMDVIVGISYGDSIDVGLEVLRKICATESRFLPDPAPQVMVVSMGDSSVNLQLRGWATSDDYWPTYWSINKRVKEEVEGAGLTIPFPQRDVHLIGEESQPLAQEHQGGVSR
ncbi:MAG: mechanosensitive ion channel [Spirochaetales bacterium]|jgi:small conductance mechanosensitive channel|nr:mechanosensitive ion channel [Spirochaetales bacterium]